MYFIKAAPGLGKTSFWRNQKGVVLGFPSNKLKAEHYEVSELAGEEKIVTPDALANFSVPVTKYLSALYEKGLGEFASIEIKKLAKGHSIFDDGDIDERDVECAAEYLIKNKLIIDMDGDLSVFTTHIRMIYQSFKQDTYVFDENTFGSLFEQLKTTVKDIGIVIEHLKIRGIDTSALEDIININDTDIHTTPDFGNFQYVIKAIVRGNHFNSNVVKFFQSTSFSIEGGFIHYQINHLSKLPTDKKLIFLDATGSETIFEKVFGGRFEMIDISNIELQGTILQDTSRSCSKMGLDAYHKKISAKVGDSTVITLKEYKKYFKNPDDTLHFGNAVGTNKLEGQDYCVVGTMSFHPMYFKFIADTLMIDCDNFEMEDLKVTYKGRRFLFRTFKNPELQKIHLEQVEGELIQCVHRGRLIRTKSTVRLFSNFPLFQATYI